MNYLITRFQLSLTYFRVMRLNAFSSFDLLELAIGYTRLIKNGGEKWMLIEWLRDTLIPALDEVRDWALEQIQEAGR